MYVCVCNRVTRQQLEQAIDEGAASLKALKKTLKLGTNCGSCLPLAKTLLTNNLQTSAAANPDLFYAA